MVNRILLTGAGFTKNFGAPLADEISGLIFNDENIQNNKKLRELFQKEHNYEDIYQKIIQSSDFNQTEKNIFNVAIQSAYKDIDDRILYGKLSQTNFDMFENLIRRFDKRRGGSGYIFTLNQDLFIERMSCDIPDYNMTLPGVSTHVHSSTEPLNQIINEDKRIFIPDEFEINRIKQEYEVKLHKINLSYIKLHGSQEWFSKDTVSSMVIGREKSNQINAISILKWYFQLFKSQLSVDNTKVLIIGYGFKDNHINSAFHNVNKNKKLQLYVVGIKPKEEFMNTLSKRDIHLGDQIINLIKGYYSTSINELFSNDGSKNFHPEWNKILKNFFDE